jgi:hypothetical protein
MGQLALERAFTLAGQSRWRDAYDSLEKYSLHPAPLALECDTASRGTISNGWWWWSMVSFLIMPGFRSNPLYASYCGMFLFILSSASRTHGAHARTQHTNGTQHTNQTYTSQLSLGAEEEWEEDGDNRSEGYKQLLQARQHLETATALHDGPALLHFLASVHCSPSSFPTLQDSPLCAACRVCRVCRVLFSCWGRRWCLRVTPNRRSKRCVPIAGCTLATRTGSGTFYIYIYFVYLYFKSIYM